MPSPRRRESYGRIAYVIVDQEDIKREAQVDPVQAPAIVDDILERSNTKNANAKRTVNNVSIGQKDQDPAAQIPPTTVLPSLPSSVSNSQAIVDVN